MENQPDDLSFRFVDHKVTDLLIFLVHPTKADTLVAKSHGAACIVAFPGELFQPCPGTDRGFQTFAGCLPVADVVHQLVHMGVEPLLSLVHAPDLDALLREPLYDKGRFIITATETVKHEHQQNVKLAFHRSLLNFLEFVTLFGRFFEAGNVAKALHPAEAGESAPTTAPSQLRQWPVQIKLVPVNAPYFDGARLLIAADCTAYAYAAFHERFIRGHITLVGCPKLDDVDYSEKLTAIIRSNDIQEVTVVRMEVPCCGGLENAAKRALQASGKFIPWQVVTISTDGRILD